jgi:hypothetical protein
MPKENVDCVAMDALRVQVGWHPNGHVQVATVHTDSPATLPGEKQDHDDTPPPVPFDGWHATLDREGVNRLIRVLRKARDSAFGADA